VPKGGLTSTDEITGTYKVVGVSGAAQDPKDVTADGVLSDHRGSGWFTTPPRSDCAIGVPPAEVRPACRSSSYDRLHLDITTACMTTSWHLCCMAM
jgi:hypothetical protein